MPGSGWCHHPQRKVSSDVKILVRRSELACRDDWSRSLWQPATGQAAGDPPFHRSAISGPVPPTSPESLRAILNHDASLASAAGEDVLLSEGRIVSETQEPWEPPSRPFPAGNFDPRTAIFKAREAYREKARAKAAAERQSAVSEAIAVTRDKVVDQPEFGSSEETARRVETTDDIDDGPGGDIQAAGGSLDDSISSHREPSLDAPPPESPGDERMQSPGQWAEPPDWHPVASEPAGEAPEAADSQIEVCLPDTNPAVSETTMIPEVRPATLARELPEWFRADLPRVCRACRDFRPAADGQRGWCANTWAFTHRQLVQEDDVAPCHSAIGDWWVSVDDVWLVAADVSTHGRATPLLDRILADEAAQRRRS